MGAPTSYLLDTLTEEQEAAVRARPYEGLVYVKAGPGSGKTRVVAARIAHLILDLGEDPREIIALTFTRAAAEEIRRRVYRDVGAVMEDVTIATFHEAALRLCPPIAPATVATRAEVNAAVDSLYKGPMRRPGRDVPNKERLLAAIQRYEATGGLNAPGSHIRGVHLVADRLRDAGLVPTWSLVPRLLIRGKHRTFAHVIVDEAQDTTTAEAQMANDLTHPDDGGVVFAVGDPRQSIMGFRHGDGLAWPDPTHQLSRTFRFGVEIAGAANELEVGDPIAGASISGRNERIPIECLEDWPLTGDTAILCRTHQDARAIEFLLPGTEHVEADPLDALASPADRLDETFDDGIVPILTVHSAKGREWDNVVVIGPSSIPWGLASDDPEERRVLYVAMTRAKRHLLGAEGIPFIGDWHVNACGLTGER